MRYELFYSTGGHGGPYYGLDEARERARKLLVGGRDRYIDVKLYTASGWELAERISRCCGECGQEVL